MGLHTENSVSRKLGYVTKKGPVKTGPHLTWTFFDIYVDNAETAVSSLSKSSNR